MSRSKRPGLRPNSEYNSDTYADSPWRNPSPARRGPIVKRLPWDVSDAKPNQASRPGPVRQKQGDPAKPHVTFSRTRQPETKPAPKETQQLPLSRSSEERVVIRTGRLEDYDTLETEPLDLSGSIDEITPISGHGQYSLEDLDIEEEGVANASVDLVQCKNCQRKFAADRIKKHVNICTKVKTRPVYNSTAARLDGDALKLYKANVERATRLQRRKGRQGIAPATTGNKTSQTSTKLSKWKAEHEYFINSIRAAKMAGGGEGGVYCASSSTTALPDVPAPVDPSLVPCPHCGRKFRDVVAERHIPRCKELGTRPIASKTPSNAQFQPPKVATKKRPTNISSTATTPSHVTAMTTPLPAVKSPTPATTPSSKSLSGSAATPGGSGGSGRRRTEAVVQEKVNCPHCGRSFEKHAALRHIDICAKVVNKPRQRSTRK